MQFNTSVHIKQYNKRLQRMKKLQPLNDRPDENATPIEQRFAERSISLHALRRGHN